MDETVVDSGVVVLTVVEDRVVDGVSEVVDEGRVVDEILVEETVVEPSVRLSMKEMSVKNLSSYMWMSSL